MKPWSCSMELEHLPSVNLVWHDLKLQHGSSNIVGIEEPFRLKVVKDFWQKRESIYNCGSPG